MVTQLIKREITLAYFISCIIALIMCVASVAGILYGSDICPASQVSNNVCTDALNLVVGIPILLGSMWFARRGSLMRPRRIGVSWSVSGGDSIRLVPGRRS